jgi:hypothetical protein
VGKRVGEKRASVVWNDTFEDKGGGGREEIGKEKHRQTVAIMIPYFMVSTSYTHLSRIRD